MLEARVLAGLGDAAKARRLLDEVKAFAASHGLGRLRLETELLQAELGLTDPQDTRALADLEAALRASGLIPMAQRARRLLPAEPGLAVEARSDGPPPISP